jgi:MFS family permease
VHPISVKGWLVLIICALCPGLTYGVIITGFAFWAGPWIDEFHVPRSTAIIAYTLGGTLMTLSGAVVGRVLDRISVRMSMAVGGLAMAVGVALAALAPAFWVVLVLFATLIPVGAAFFGQVPAQTLATRMFPHHTGLVNGVIISGLTLSGMLMALIAPPLVASVGWRGAFLTLAAAIAFVVVPLGWFLYNDPAGRPIKTPPPAPGDTAATAGGLGVLRTPAFWLVLIPVLTINFGASAIPPNAVDIARDARLDPAVGALFLSIFAIAGTVGSLGGGWLCDRIGLRLVYAGVGVLYVIALGIFALQPGLVPLAVAMGLSGMAGAALLPWMAASVAQRFGPAAFGKVVGLLGAFFIPAAFYPILVAWIRDASGSYRPAWLLSAAIIALGMTTLLSMRGQARSAAAAPAVL